MATQYSNPGLQVAKQAIGSLGLGFDLANDLNFEFCKWDSKLLVIDQSQCSDVELVDGICIPSVSNSIEYVKCTGEAKRISSDALPFSEMIEQFNKDVSLFGRIPSGHCNAAFGLSGCWAKDAACTKALAFDGVFVVVYSFTLKRSQWELDDQVRKAVPTAWDPAALAEFIKKFGTHVIVGLTLGGNDAVYARQYCRSHLEPEDMRKLLKHTADKTLLDSSPTNSFEIIRMERASPNDENIEFMYRRKGGSGDPNLLHKQWLQTVESNPDIVSASFIPLTSFLSGVPGIGYVSHAINLYLRYKPAVEDLQHFLEFQLPREWAPVVGVLALGPRWKQEGNKSLKFGFMVPKLYINTNMVDVGKRPVTGLRLSLEGRRNNCLAIHLQHLSSLPTVIHFSENSNANFSNSPNDHKFYRKVQWSSFSHICTAPVESDEDLSIVTGAKFELGNYGLTKILFLRLHFSTVIRATVVKQPEWDNPSVLDCNIGAHVFSTTYTKNQKEKPKPGDVTIASGAHMSLPTPVQQPKLLRFVDTTEMTRGPQDTPGYWVVSGARLDVINGKICLLVKYSLLNFTLTFSKDSF